MSTNEQISVEWVLSLRALGLQINGDFMKPLKFLVPALALGLLTACVIEILHVETWPHVDNLNGVTNFQHTTAVGASEDWYVHTIHGSDPQYTHVECVGHEGVVRGSIPMKSPYKMGHVETEPSSIGGGGWVAIGLTGATPGLSTHAWLFRFDDQCTYDSTATLAVPQTISGQVGHIRGVAMDTTGNLFVGAVSSDASGYTWHVLRHDVATGVWTQAVVATAATFTPGWDATNIRYDDDRDLIVMGNEVQHVLDPVSLAEVDTVTLQLAANEILWDWDTFGGYTAAIVLENYFDARMVWFDGNGVMDDNGFPVVASTGLTVSRSPVPNTLELPVWFLGVLNNPGYDHMTQYNLTITSL